MVEREHCNSCRHECHHEVFVERIGSAKDGQMEEHDRQELA